jgi:hypothetical protein
LADAASCLQNSTTSCNGISFLRFMVKFWDEKSIKMQSIFQAVIHAPSCWRLDHFLDVIEEVSRNETVLSLIHGYYFNGKHFLLATINVLHHHFKI